MNLFISIARVLVFLISVAVVAGMGTNLFVAIGAGLLAVVLVSYLAGSLNPARPTEPSQPRDTTTGDGKKALDALRRDRDLLDSVLQGMNEAVLLLDREGRIVLTNSALREMLALSDDPVGKLTLEVVRSPELKAALDHAGRAKEPIRVEIELADLNPRRLLVHARRLEGAPGGLLAGMVDVTDLRRLESMRRDFVANVSHELRTPVTAIASAAETMGGMGLDPQAMEFVSMVGHHAERLRRLVEDLLDLSGIESKEFRIEPVRVDLKQAADQQRMLHREGAEEAGVILRFETGETSVEGDPRALEQVLSNLIDNAIKYAGRGATVSLRAKVRDQRVEIEVEDTGSGIEEKHLVRIFERFYRVDPGRSRDAGGTGLGLAIVKHLVEAMGGTVSVQSTLGKGTKFVVDLPG